VFDPHQQNMTAVSFSDRSNGEIVTAGSPPGASPVRGGAIFSTSDGGRTWAEDAGSVTNALDPGGQGAGPALRAVDLTVPSDTPDHAARSLIHVAGDGGAIAASNAPATGFLSSVGSAAFASQPSGSGAALYGTTFTDRTHGWAAGQGGTIVSTADGGSTWTAQASGTTAALRAVAFPNPDQGYVVGDAGTILGLEVPAPPGLTVSQVTPDRGPLSGHLSVTIIGHGFSHATDVNFGTAFARGFEVLSDTKISALLPAHGVGTVTVTVDTAEGVSSTSPSTGFTYLNPVGGIWQPTGTCVGPCLGPATKLTDGKVLVEGAPQAGAAADATTAAQLYDPATRSWHLTSSMVVPRQGHTATLLRNGKVLVTGGVTFDGANNVTATAELYDPATNSWRLTGSMHHPRSGATATLLRNGTVLVAGGGGGGVLASAELYDPATGHWKATGPMGHGVYDGTATRLKDGTVLVIGDELGNAGPGTVSAQLYDPATGTWSVTGSLLVPTAGFTATALDDGEVLVAGGEHTNPQRPRSYLPFAELYDPAMGTWAATGPMAIARAGHTATLLPDGKVLVAGGGVRGFATDCPCGPAPNAELYDPISGRWSLTGAMISPGYDAHATLLADGTVLVAGGQNPDLGPGPGSAVPPETFLPAVPPGATGTGHGTLERIVLAIVAVGIVVMGVALGWRWWRGRSRRRAKARAAQLRKAAQAPEREIVRR
jgi:hypothetical protein